MSTALEQYAVVRFNQGNEFFAILLSLDDTGRCRILSPTGGLIILDRTELITHQAMQGASASPKEVRITFLQLGTSPQEIEQTLSHFCLQGNVVLEAFGDALTLPGQYYSFAIPSLSQDEVPL